MIKLGRQLISNICLITFAFFLAFGPFNLDLNALTINQNDKLIARIAKDFSKKFCNGIGFGLSQESALNFAMKENMAIFKNKGIENIDNKIIAEKMAIAVNDKCGYSINLLEE
tara:strand:+ start:248 stop:586 length:339 start_codon:yes stop_codon:yes gene_type:complete